MRICVLFILQKYLEYSIINAVFVSKITQPYYIYEIFVYTFGKCNALRFNGLQDLAENDFFVFKKL